MREEPTSACEREFILQSILSNLRIDGRMRDEFRSVKLVVGSEVGTALCTLGNTKVFCSVVGHLTEPMRSRPAKGMINVEVDMSPMANANFQHNRLGQKGIELRRMLKIVLSDSRCIDTESLCVRSGKQVWKLVVNVKILDDDGSLLDCASVAAVTALHHYRRPNVTVEPNRTIIHSEWEQPLVPLNIHHMPICVMYGFTNDGAVSIVDPCAREEKYLDGCLWIALNKRKEICALHQTNRLVMSTSMIEDCVRKAFDRAMNLTDLIHEVCTDDAAQRAKYKKPAGFDVTVDSEFLNTNESEPNELIAPATSAAAKRVDQGRWQPSVILNENPLLQGVVRMTNEQEDEDMKIAGQVENIVASVGECNISAAPAASVAEASAADGSASQHKEKQRKQKKKGQRQKDVEDMNSLLDDLEGEITELKPHAVLGETAPESSIQSSTMEVDPPEQSGVFDLTTAKRKKRK